LIILYIFAVKNRNGDIEYYQVSYTVNDEKTFEREFSSLRTLRDSYPKYILTLDYDNAIIDGIQKINVIVWLLNK
jgi:predicted AAA+ superfamily ATPase